MSRASREADGSDIAISPRRICIFTVKQLIGLITLPAWLRFAYSVACAHVFSPARYVDSGFDAEHPVLRWFWEWLDNLKEDSKRRLLVFWSGSSRVPPFGFQDDAINEGHRWAIAQGLERDACPDVSTW